MRDRSATAFSVPLRRVQRRSVAPFASSGSSIRINGFSKNSRIDDFRGRTAVSSSSHPAKVSPSGGRSRRPAPASAKMRSASSAEQVRATPEIRSEAAARIHSICGSSAGFRGSNLRIDSISSPKNSTRTGCACSGENTSRIPPRIEYSPTISTGSLRSYPTLSRCAAKSSRGTSSLMRRV